jgi:hypothetical protein
MHPARAPRAHLRSPAHPCSLAVAAVLCAAILSSSSCGIASIAAAETSLIGGSGSGCVLVSMAGSDTARFTGTRHLSPGRGYAQTFVADDTVMSSVSVWLPSWQRQPESGLHLWITQVGHDGRPRPDLVIADAGSLSGGAGENLSAACYRFNLMPAIVLPARGRYAMVVAAEHCEALDVLTTGTRLRGAGDLYETSYRGCSGGPGTRGARSGTEVLAFRIEFCDLSTAARGRTWGEIKSVYR